MSSDYTVENSTAESVKTVKREGFEGSKQSVWVVLLSVIIGLWVMFTMTDFAAVGINWFIFVLLTVMAVAIMMYLDDNLNIPIAVFWITVIAAIGSAFARMQDFPVLAFLFLPTAIVFFTIYAAKQKREGIISQFLYRHFAFFVHFWNLFLVRFGGKKDGEKGNMAKVLWGIGISVVLLLIIVPVMFSADVMFETIMEKAFDFNLFDNFIGRLVWGIVVTLLSFAFLFTITVKKHEPYQSKNRSQNKQDIGATIITVLSVLGVVFLAFVIIQIRFLFFRSSGALPQGLTYAEYAVDGYWSQAALTALNLVVVLIALRLSKGTAGKTKSAVNGLLTGMTALNTYLVISAAYKMHLYENAYGFTEKRLMVYLILFFELITLGLLVYSVFKRNFPFIKTVVYMGAAYFAVVACLNLDAISVKQNIKRYEVTGEIDTYYMCHEASDAAYVVKDFYLANYNALRRQDKNAIEEYFVTNSYDDGESVSRSTYNNYGGESWYEFNLSRYRKYRADIAVLEFLNEQ